MRAHFIRVPRLSETGVFKHLNRAINQIAHNQELLIPKETSTNKVSVTDQGVEHKPTGTGSSTATDTEGRWL